MVDPLLISNIDNSAGENVVDNTITNYLDILMYDNEGPTLSFKFHFDWKYDLYPLKVSCLISVMTKHELKISNAYANILLLVF